MRIRENRQQNLGVTWTRVMSSSVVGEARYGVGIRSTNVDIAAGNDTPIIRFTGSPVRDVQIGTPATSRSTAIRRTTSSSTT